MCMSQCLWMSLPSALERNRKDEYGSPLGIGKNELTGGAYSPPGEEAVAEEAVVEAALAEEAVVEDALALAVVVEVVVDEAVVEESPRHWNETEKISMALPSALERMS